MFAGDVFLGVLMNLIGDNSRKKCFTLVEVLVGILIVAIVFSGLAASFISVRRYTNTALKRLVSVNLVRAYFSLLTHDVNATSWNAGNLSNGTHDTVFPTRQIDQVNYTTSYVVDTLPGREIRRVNMTINFTNDTW